MKAMTGEEYVVWSQTDEYITISGADLMDGGAEIEAGAISNSIANMSSRLLLLEKNRSQN